MQVEVAFCVEHLKGPFWLVAPELVNQGMPVDLGVEDQEVLAKLAYDVVAQRCYSEIKGISATGAFFSRSLRSPGQVFSVVGV